MSAPLAAWVAASIVLHTLVAAGAWLVARRSSPGVGSLRYRAASGLLRWIARAAFYVGVPYAALIGGIAMPAQFALGAPDVAQALVLLPAAAGVFFSGALIMALYARFVTPRYPLQVRPAVRRRAQLAQPWGFAFILLDALFFQAHWTFYRAGAALVLPELTVWAGAAAVLTEWLLDPGWLTGWRAAGIWEDQFIQLALMLFSAHLALLGAGFWLSLCAHAVLWIGWLALLHLLHRS